MNTADIQTLYEYDRWANARVLGAASKLSQDQFTREMGSSFGSIRGTLVHILSGERTWLSRWNGVSPSRSLDAAQFPSCESVQRAWTELERDLGAFLSQLTDERLREVVSYQTLSGARQSQPLWQQMAHLANHSTYHRGQLTTLLRQLGEQPVGTDLITFFREQSGPKSGP